MTTNKQTTKRREEINMDFWSELGVRTQAWIAKWHFSIIMVMTVAILFVGMATSCPAYGSN
jgi:hypothetical protein